MILADTSVWIDHLRVNEPLLVSALDRGIVVIHPFVVGELACENLKNRAEVITCFSDWHAHPWRQRQRYSHSSKRGR